MFYIQSRNSNTHSLLVGIIDPTTWHFPLVAVIWMQLGEYSYMLYHIDIGLCRELEIPIAGTYNEAQSIIIPVSMSHVYFHAFKPLFEETDLGRVYYSSRWYVAYIGMWAVLSSVHFVLDQDDFHSFLSMIMWSLPQYEHLSFFNFTFAVFLQQEC